MHISIYKVQHILGTQNSLADYIFRLPSLSEKCDSAKKIHSIVLTEQLPILVCQIAKVSETDKVILSLIILLQHGNWPSNKSLTSFYNWNIELPVVDGV